MAPTRQKKRNSTESVVSVEMQDAPASTAQKDLDDPHSPLRTPVNSSSPVRRARAGITLAQKQQLIDNLQQEVTERARRLRQQYNAQAQDLRIRVERRVTRIPMHLRRANMGELLQKYNEMNAKPVISSSSPTKSVSTTMRSSPPKTVLKESRYTRQSPAPQQRVSKRKSDEISATDKENENIENPKKRSRPAAPIRTTPRRDSNEPHVLSPKSPNNSGLRSPFQPSTAFARSQLARPISPMKSIVAPTGGSNMLTNMVEKAKSTRVAATRKANENTANIAAGGRSTRTGRLGATSRAAKARASDSNSSEASTGTTIVRKPAPPPKKVAVKRTVMSTIKGIGGPASKKLPAAKTAPATGTRVLRKRN